MFSSSRFNKLAGGVLLTLGAGLALVYSVVTDSVYGEQEDSRAEAAVQKPATGEQPTRVAQLPQADHSRAGGADNEKPTLKAYPCPSGQASALAERLKQEFSQTAGVRIVVDRRTSRLLVFAPPRFQQQMARRIEQLIATGPIAPETTPKSLSIKLKRLAIGRLEGRLLEIMGPRFVPVTPTAPEVANYRVALPGGGKIALTLKHRENTAFVQGPAAGVDSFAKLLRALDVQPAATGQDTRMVAIEAARPEKIRRAVDAIHFANEDAPRGSLVSMLLQQPGGGEGAAPAETDDGTTPAETPPTPPGLLGPVQIELLEGLDVVVIRGNQRDVEKVTEIIAQIEQLSRETEPIIEIHQLREVDCTSMSKLVTPLYDKVFSPRQGSISITALVKPNALLLVGRDTSVKAAIDLIRRLDQPVMPQTQFRVFSLRHAAAANARQTIEAFFDRSEEDEEDLGLGTKIKVTADFRSNSLIVQAAPRDMAEVAEMIARIDTPKSEAFNEVKVFKLENSLAEELAEILQQAISGDISGRRTGTQPRGAPGGTGGGTSTARQIEQRSAMLRFLAVDSEGSRLLSSGILLDVRITADPRANALLVTAGADSMELIGELIKAMDRLPAAEAQVKVFTIINGDAESLARMLEALFAEQGGSGEPAVRTAAVEGESSLVTLRFAVDMRTNSIIASGSRGDLQVVEAILLRLDDSDMRDRKSIVYRLRNSPAQYVAQAINEFLRSERQVQQITPGVLSPFEQIEQEVVVVPETVSNSLIISATPRFFDEVQALVEKLDQRPPMVMIQVLIAEVKLNDTDEFGIELGIQDSILFDRSLLDDIQTISRTTFNTVGNPVSSQDVIVSADNQPGFAFNNQAMGNSGSESSLTTAGIVAAQALSHFDVGRVNDELGFGGMVLSASSESVSILVRALQECRRLEILSRPQIMTLDNQPAFIQVGQRVPRIVGTQLNEVGQTNNITLENVGLIMGVTPRISPDGLVVMEIDAEKSDVGPEEDGIPVSISEGQVIRSPKINTTTVQTTVSALSGQTVVLGGLIIKGKKEAHRKVPFFGDLPILGHFFRYDGVAQQRTELLIILTPRIVRNEGDMEQIKQVEAARMNWCLRDVMELQGEVGMRCRADEWHDSETEVVYPDGTPSELVPLPEQSFGNMEMVPAPAGTFPKPELRGVVPPGPSQPSPPQSPPLELEPLELEPALPVNPPPTMRIEQPRTMPTEQPRSQPQPQSQPQPAPTGTELRIRPAEQSSSWPRTDAPVVQQAVYQPQYQQQPPYRR